MFGATMFIGATNEALQKLDEASDVIRKLMDKSRQSMVTAFWRQLDLSTIYHDCALEGEVVTPEELDAAFDVRNVADAAHLQLYASLRFHRRAFDHARTLAADPDLEFGVDTFKDFHRFFVEEAEDGGAGRYRKDIPLHRTYFHEIAEPAKISGGLRKIVAWLNDLEEEVELHPVTRAARFHLRFMKLFPYAKGTGKVGRTVMNMMLIRAGYLPAVIHGTERQRYYESLRHNGDELLELVIDSANASMDAAQKFLQRP